MSSPSGSASDGWWRNTRWLEGEEGYYLFCDRCDRLLWKNDFYSIYVRWLPGLLYLCLSCFLETQHQ